MRTYEADNTIKSGMLLDHYRGEFEKYTGEKPVLDVSESMDILKWMTNNVGYDRTRTLISRYFQTKDEWIKGQGFSLIFLKNNVNKIITTTGVLNSVPKPLYVVNISDSGTPITSNNPNIFAGETRFVPQLWDDWVRCGVEQKLALSTKSEKNNVHRWMEVGSDVSAWITLWCLNSWLQKEVSEVKLAPQYSLHTPSI